MIDDGSDAEYYSARLGWRHLVDAFPKEFEGIDTVEDAANNRIEIEKVRADGGIFTITLKRTEDGDD